MTPYFARTSALASSGHYSITSSAISRTCSAVADVRLGPKAVMKGLRGSGGPTLNFPSQIAARRKLPLKFSPHDNHRDLLV